MKRGFQHKKEETLPLYKRHQICNLTLFVPAKKEEILRKEDSHPCIIGIHLLNSNINREPSVAMMRVLGSRLRGCRFEYHQCHCIVSLSKIITIHHECPCRIEISHPSGRNFNQGRGLPSPWLNSDPEGEISLSYMDRLMMDRFLPLFEAFLSEHKISMKT